ncbi:MAG: hypothetical protein WB239_05220, partial [Acidimicrobiia bacterium]
VPLLSRSHDVHLPERLRAQRANRLAAEIIVSIGLSEGPAAVYYFQSGHSRSEAGVLLAAAIAPHLDGTVQGRATPMLKETRAPAVVIEAPGLSEKTGVAIVDGIEEFFLAGQVDQVKNRR